MNCNLCSRPMRQSLTSSGYCQTCNIFIQSLDLHEAYMEETGQLERHREFLEARTLIVKQKIKILEEIP